MRTTGNLRVPVGVAVATGIVFLASCATTSRPQQFRTFFLPPQNHLAASTAADPVPDPPQLHSDLYANEVPAITTSIPDVLPRPSDTDFILKRAEDRLTAGRLAYQSGQIAEARREFNRALEVLLTAPENTPDRSRIEHRLEDMVDAIYRYDVEPSGAEDDKPAYDKAPRDGILEMTFPVDPSLRSKIKEQIHATTSQLPLEESDAVLGAINFFSSERGKRIIAAGLRRQGRYKSMIERILAEEGLPQELIFVAQAESGFSPRAVSNKACVGLWQFAKFRGNEYGLHQTPSTDDRMDPEKATRAAARHLHDLYEHFGDWYLALAAYDCGPGCVDHAVMRTGYADFWALRRLHAFPQRETDNYVPVIVAMTIIAKNAKAYGLDNLELDRPMEFDTLELQTSTHLALAADAVERPLAELKDLNPGLLRSVAPAGYSLHVPKGTLAALESAFAVIPANRRDSWRVHRIRDGETFAGLAKQFSAQTALLSSANHEELPAAGEWAAIPVAYPGDRTAPAKKTTTKAAARKKSTTTTASHKSKAPAHRAQTSKAHSS
ncbi:MAG TPA: lytic transglycosylase domain-containing protein [Bryobacteraceae bacterium]|nr:lytic transglycosylase domain-containing protein [Bryobacteraceae bacterium]